MASGQVNNITWFLFFLHQTADRVSTNRWSAVSSLVLSRWAGPVQEFSGESWQRQSALCAPAPLPRWPETGRDHQGTSFPLGQKCSVDSSLITAHLVIWSFLMKQCADAHIHTGKHTHTYTHAFTLYNIIRYSTVASKTTWSSSLVGGVCKTVSDQQ